LETGRTDARPAVIDALARAVYAELPDLLREPAEGEPSGRRVRETADRRTEPLPEAGDRVVLIATGLTGVVQERTRCAFTGLTFFRIDPDDFPYPLVQSSLGVRREGS
jgi:hypothetical protein